MANNTVNNLDAGVFVPCYHFSNISFGRGRLPGPLVTNCVLNSVFCVVATVGNILVLNALRKASSLYLPSKMLLLSLVLSDLCVGLIVHPVYITFLISKMMSLPKTFCESGIVLFLTSSASNSTSLLTVVVLSLDRYAAFYIPIKYKSTVTVKRTSFLLVAVWLYSGFWSTTILWSEQFYYTLAGISLLICIPITAVAYLKIYHGLKRQEKLRARSLSDVMRYRRTVSNSLWLYCILLICYLPYLSITAVAAVTGVSPIKIQILEFTSTLVFINSSLNPFVYCWRIPEIRGVAKEALQTLQFWKQKNSRNLWSARQGDLKQRRCIQESLNINLENINVDTISYRVKTFQSTLK